VLCSFEGARAADRRLRTLVDNGFLNRKKYIYGIPFLYTLTHKGKIIIGANKREDKIRLDRIAHDIYVLDTVIYFMEKYNLNWKNLKSEKDLHIKDGFGERKHHADFAFEKDGKDYAVEIELNQKASERIKNNVRDNYMGYDTQIWVADTGKVLNVIKGLQDEYPNIEIIELREVLEHIKERYK
jgi:predicted DNA binding CopG/RHH family protein